MAASIVANGRMFLSLLLLVLLGLRVAAQSVEPSNDTLSSAESNSELVLQIQAQGLFNAKDYNVAPLEAAAGLAQSSTTINNIIISGHPKVVDASTVANLTTGDVAIISCDPNGSNIQPSTIVGQAGDIKPRAIVLYSITAESCNLTGGYTYQTLYTITTRQDSWDLMNTVKLFPADAPNLVMAQINANSSTSNSAANANDGGPAPTTAVAMSILYSITGIITLLFLVIIATGAIRAHRHPERYGPRNGFPGRPRQSRAKGLARAMLETLPIVKFGDPEPAKPGVDVELEDGHSSHTATTEVPTATGAAVIPQAREVAAAESTESGLAAASVHSKESPLPEGDHLGCSICTEDFEKGDDLRVLPCNHRYHPACIDPWLLNVSGTCPLCRRDLRPVTSETSNPDAAPGEAGDLPPPLDMDESAEHAPTTEGEGSSPQHRRMTRFLDINRLRHATPEERIAHLRELRQQTRSDINEGESPEEHSASRREKVTSKLKNVFHIKTRTSEG